MFGELVQQREEMHLMKCAYESTREHMKQQAEQSEEQDRDIDTLYKDFPRMKGNFKNLQSVQTNMNKKLEYKHWLTPMYLAGLQETRGDIDRLAQNIDQEIREQKKTDQDAREYMQKQWVQLLKGTQEGLTTQHHDLCS